MAMSATGVVTTSAPSSTDGTAMWEIAGRSRVLDVNSRYAYVLWCRDFSDTSIVARLDDQVVGFVTGYRRPSAPDVLFVWQVAVDAAARGRGVAGALLDDLAARVGCTYLETTITADNAASVALFTAFAKRHGADIERTELFGRPELGDAHDPEFLHRIGPLQQRGDN
jgi:L-2,4-diaminobutyric acid acetyltransferase